MRDRALIEEIWVEDSNWISEGYEEDSHMVAEFNSDGEVTKCIFRVEDGMKQISKIYRILPPDILELMGEL